MRSLHSEAHDRPFLFRIGRAEDSEGRDLAKDVMGMPQQPPLVVGEFLGGELAQVIDRGAQPDGLGDRRCAGLELPGDLVPFGPLAIDADDHVAAEAHRWHGLEQLSLAVEYADSCRPEKLVSRESHEIDPQPAEVQAMMRQALCRVNQDAGPACVNHFNDPLQRRNRAGDIRHPGHRDQAHPVSQRGIERVEVEPGVIRQRDILQLDVPLSSQHLPGHEVGMMLGLSQEGGFPGGSLWTIPLEMCSIVGELTPISIDGGSPMSTITQRIASAFVVLCGRYGDVTKMAHDREQSRQSLYREASQVANAVDGTAVQSRIDELQRQLAGQQAQIQDLQERLEHAIEITRDKQDEFASVAQAEGVSLSVARRLLQVVAGSVTTPSVPTLGRATEEAGQRAGQLLEVLDEVAQPKVKQATADEIFFNEPTKS